MKSITLVFLFAVLLGVSAGADQTPQPLAPLYQCAVTFKAQGGGLQAIVGKFVLTGTGNLRCADVTGKTLVVPVNVAVGGGTAARLAIGYFSIIGSASGLGWVSSPESLFGKYASVGALGAFAGGLGATVAMHATKSNVTLNANFQLAKGFGLELGYSTLQIEPAVSAAN
jgi:hypothetical protein